MSEWVFALGPWMVLLGAVADWGWECRWAGVGTSGLGAMEDAGGEGKGVSCAWGRGGGEGRSRKEKGWARMGGECAVVRRGMALLKEGNMRDASVGGTVLPMLRCDGM